jgi:hypothetical protein
MVGKGEFIVKELEWRPNCDPMKIVRINMYAVFVCIPETT